jgi:hypothetical protein
MILIEMELLNHMHLLIFLIHYVNIRIFYLLFIIYLNIIGFNLSPSTLETILKRYSTRADDISSAKISFEHYVQLCARLTLLNGMFKQKIKQKI